MITFRNRTGPILELAVTAAVTFALLSAAAPAALSAQSASSGIARAEVTRAELTDLVEQLRLVANADAYSQETRDAARDEMRLIQTRLQMGDFQLGDQIALVVEGEEALTGTFQVERGPALLLPDIGRVPLEGVLRSELGDHVETEISRYIRNPVVRAQGSFRVMVTGAVGSSGYYLTATSALLSDVLMLAGGPTSEARLDRIRVERGGRSIWEGDTLQQAIIEGRTLDQMNMRAGDEIIVPAQASGGVFDQVMRFVPPVAMIVTLALQMR